MAIQGYSIRLGANRWRHDEATIKLAEPVSPMAVRLELTEANSPLHRDGAKTRQSTELDET